MMVMTGVKQLIIGGVLFTLGFVTLITLLERRFGKPSKEQNCTNMDPEQRALDEQHRQLQRILMNSVTGGPIDQQEPYTVRWPTESQVSESASEQPITPVMSNAPDALQVALPPDDEETAQPPHPYEEEPPPAYQTVCGEAGNSGGRVSRTQMGITRYLRRTSPPPSRYHGTLV